MAIVKIVSLCVLLFLVQRSESVCTPDRVCDASRDIIQHADATVPLLEKVTHNFRSWTIEPTNTMGNILLAFKSFNTPDVGIVEVLAKKYDGSEESRVFSGNRGNFETIMTNTWQVIINVTLGVDDTNFTMLYYAGCEIVTHSIIQHRQEEEGSRKCLIVLPNIEGYLNRIYTTLRRISLPDNMQLLVQDVHTGQIVADVEGEQYFQKAAIQASITVGGLNSFFILIDFKCNDEECDYSSKHYIISYYAMREKDIFCIEQTKWCNSRENAHNLCNIRCPALDAMVEQEYMLERMTATSEADANVEEQEQRSLRKSITRRDRSCPFRDESRCHCSRNVTLDMHFCPDEVYCFEEGNCTWRCIVMKMTTCLKIKLIKVIKFF